MQLIVSDYIKHNPTQSQRLAEATDVIAWFNNHSFALHLLYAEEKTYPQFKDMILTLIKACITRWNSHVLAVKRLNVLWQPLQTTAFKHTAQLREAAGKTHDLKAKADKIIATITHQSFWDDLEVYVNPFYCVDGTLNEIQYSLSYRAACRWR
jgi:hypothetical protein